MRWLRILLVEDDAAIGALVSELLTEMGHEVCGVVTTETDAVSAAATHLPDLMIVDVGLRVGSGVSAMATILGSSTIPHIYMTGSGRHMVPPGSIILVKPFGRERLEAALAIGA